MFKNYSQLDYFNMLPISDKQKLQIIEDFIKTDLYDKIEKEGDLKEEKEGDLKED